MAKTLTIYLAADTRKLSSGLSSAERQMTGFGNSLTNFLGPALIAATAAAGALAIKLGIEGVQAAAADEKAVASLAKTMENLGLAQDTGRVEAFIDALQRQTGVADDQLRPAFDRLVRSIGDTAQAQQALQLALDISSGSGRSLDQVTQALGRAYDGNTTALSRLGAGIDASILKTGDMERITASLAATFSGQAQVAANTFEGRLKRVKIAADEVEEAFGYGLLSNLDSVFQRMDDAAGATGGLEDRVNRLGAEIGLLISGVVELDRRINLLGGTTNDTEDDVLTFGEILENVGQGFIGFRNGGEGAVQTLMDIGAEANSAASSLWSVYRSTTILTNAINANKAATDGNTAASARYTAQAKALGAEIGYGNRGLQRYNAYLEELETRSGPAGSSSDQLTDRLERQKETVSGLQQALKTQISELERGAQAVNNYVASVAGRILGGLDLGDAYAQQFDEQGNRVGKTLIEAFQAQVDQAEWFGNVLNAIRASGGSERLINAIAAEGPAAGGALGQQILDEGLIPTLDAKLSTATEAANKVGLAMAGTFAPNGVSASIQMVNGIAEQLGKEGKRLGKIGKEMGKPIGDRLKAEIAQAVAEAVRAAQAAQTAAAAEAAANAANQAAAASEQAIAQAVQRLINNSNQRAGRDTQPVLT